MRCVLAGILDRTNVIVCNIPLFHLAVQTSSFQNWFQICLGYIVANFENLDAGGAQWFFLDLTTLLFAYEMLDYFAIDVQRSIRDIGMSS